MTQNSAGDYFAIAFRVAILTGRLEQIRKAPAQIGAAQAEQANNQLRARRNDQAGSQHHGHKCNYGIYVLESHGFRLVVRSLGQREEGVQRKSPVGTILVKVRAAPSPDGSPQAIWRCCAKTASMRLRDHQRTGTGRFEGGGAAPQSGDI